MERLQGVISLRAADTSAESSYCFGGSLVNKIRAVGSLKELNLVKACGDLKMTCVLSYFVLVIEILKYSCFSFLDYNFLFYVFCVFIFIG